MADQITANSEAIANTALSRKQRRRVDALRAARLVTSSSRGLMNSAPAQPADLVSVARFILTGDDPWTFTATLESTDDDPRQPPEDNHG